MAPIPPAMASGTVPVTRVARITAMREEHRAAHDLLRAAIAHEFGDPDYHPVVDQDGRPCWNDGICWSITHKFPWVAAAVSREPVGIDLEVRCKRDPALFSLFTEKEWNLLGKRDWLPFYLLWTAKEAAIKRERATIDALCNIRLVAWRGSDLLLQYHGKDISVRSTVTDAYVCSLTVQ